MVVLSVINEVIWEVFVNETVYDLTDPVGFGYLIPYLNWPGGAWPVVVVKHVVADRPIGDPDMMLQGWSIARLWSLWATLLAASLILSLLLTRFRWSRR
ncbi:MAG: hypothetical protein WDO13_08705 [Verrucomicrobiota bacterium]